MQLAPAAKATWRAYVAACLLLVLGVAAYSNAVTNQFIGIDTLQNVRDNPDIRALVPLSRALSLHRGGSSDDDSTLIRRPVLSLSFALTYVLLGPEAWGFQAGNVAIHIAAALLLFGIARRMLALRGYADDRRGCWLAFGIAAIWVVHPLTTESVSNIVQRAESLMGFFALLTLYCATRYWQATRTATVEREYHGALRWSAGAVIACALGMGTKEVMVVVPVLVWLCDAIVVCRSFAEPFRRRRRFYLALAATWAIPALLVTLTLENTSPDFESARFVPYVLSQPHAIMHYLRLAFWPHPLFHYIVGRPFWFDPGVDPWSELLRYAVPLGVLACGTLAAVLRLSPAGFLGAAFFLPLLPTSLLTTFTVVQEHRVYLPLAAVATAAVLVADALIVRSVPRSWRAGVHVLLLVSTLAGLVYGTRLRNEDYRSDLTLWAPDDVPLAFAMRSGLAVYQSKLPEAAEVLESMVATAKSANADEPLFSYRVRAASALGAVRILQARFDEAQQLFAQALAEDPSYAPAENNLAVALFLSGNRPAARQHLQLALRLDPTQAAAHYNYGLVCVMDGNGVDASDHLARADELLPAAARLGEDQRRALVQADLGRFQFSAVLSPPDSEFSMDYKLALVPGSPAR